MSNGSLLYSHSFWVAYFIIGYIIAVAIAMWVYWTFNNLDDAIILGGMVGVAWPAFALVVVMGVLIGGPVIISEALKWRR